MAHSLHQQRPLLLCASLFTFFFLLFSIPPQRIPPLSERCWQQYFWWIFWLRNASKNLHLILFIWNATTAKISCLFSIRIKWKFLPTWIQQEFSTTNITKHMIIYASNILQWQQHISLSGIFIILRCYFVSSSDAMIHNTHIKLQNPVKGD